MKDIRSFTAFVGVAVALCAWAIAQQAGPKPQVLITDANIY